MFYVNLAQNLVFACRNENSVSITIECSYGILNTFSTYQPFMLLCREITSFLIQSTSPQLQPFVQLLISLPVMNSCMCEQNPVPFSFSVDSHLRIFRRDVLHEIFAYWWAALYQVEAFTSVIVQTIAITMQKIVHAIVYAYNIAGVNWPLHKIEK